MTDTQEAVQDAGLPEPLERGRYAIFGTPEGGWAVARAAGICGTCVECGCGEQQEPFQIPAVLIPFLTGEAELTPAGMMKLVKGMMGNGK